MYNNENIQKLKPMEHVRLRPGMYLGGTDQRALHHLLYLVVDNAMDEEIVGQAKHIHITLQNENSVRVEDDSAGIPVDHYQDSGFTFMELWISLGKGTYYRENKTFGGSFGVGVAAVNAVSARFAAEVKRDGYLWRQEYQQGEKVTALIQVRPLAVDEGTGTTITFTPDFTILEPNDFDYTVLANRLRELAFLVRGLTITLKDERSSQQETFHYPDGLADFVRYLNVGQPPLHEVIYQAEEVDFTPEGKNYTYHIKVEFAFQYVDSSANRELSFANTQATLDGGTHIYGFQEAMHRTLNRYARELGLLTKADSNFTPAEIGRGLTVVLSVYHPHSSFESQTKVRLMNPEMQGIVTRVVSEALVCHPDSLQRILERFLQNRRQK